MRWMLRFCSPSARPGATPPSAPPQTTRDHLIPAPQKLTSWPPYRHLHLRPRRCHTPSPNVDLITGAVINTSVDQHHAMSSDFIEDAARVSHIRPPTSLASPSQAAPPLMKSADELRERLENLPQELYDHIRNLTLTYDSDFEGRCIGLDYKPPFQLQINQSMRAEYSTQYYAMNATWVFVYRTSWSPHYRLKRVERWLDSLTHETRQRFDEQARTPRLEYEHMDFILRGRGRVFEVRARKLSNLMAEPVNSVNDTTERFATRFDAYAYLL